MFVSYQRPVFESRRTGDSQVRIYRRETSMCSPDMSPYFSLLQQARIAGLGFIDDGHAAAH